MNMLNRNCDLQMIFTNIVDNYLKLFDEVQPIDINLIGLDQIPRKYGVYLWATKADNKPFYIGQANGNNGLYRRIVKNYLCESYKKNKLRKKIIKNENLKDDKEAIEYLKNECTLKYICLDKCDEIIRSSLLDTIEEKLIYKNSEFKLYNINKRIS